MIKFLLIKFLGPIDYRFYIPEIFGVIKELLWPITVLLIASIFRREISRLIGRIKSIKYKGMSVETVPSAGEALSIPPKPFQLTKGAKEPERAIAELAFLLSKYQFVWSAWTSRPEYSHAVRFSEEYAGGKLRYIDQYCSELKYYDKKFGASLPNDIKSKFDDLRSYLESILPYHNIQEELTSPIFSRPKYLELFGDLAGSLKNASIGK